MIKINGPDLSENEDILSGLLKNQKSNAIILVKQEM